MKPITKHFLQTLLLTGVTYGAIMTGYDWVSGEPLYLWKLALRTFGFGIPMAIIAAYSYKKQLKTGHNTTNKESELGVTQSRYFSSTWDLPELLQQLKSDPVMAKMKVVEIENGLLLKSGTSWKSWGEVIRINRLSAADNGFEYELISKPKVVTTIVDYGKNAENVRRIETLLNGSA